MKRDFVTKGLVLLLTLAILGLGCSASDTVKGGAIGAAAGGVLGGLIGKAAGNTAVGAIIGVRTSGDSTPVPMVASPFTELHPALSPDGRWLAYTSNESGVNEVYVRPFPNTASGRWQVSNGGGSQPRWSSDGRTLFLLDASLRLVEARLAPGSALAVSGLRTLFPASNFAIDAFHSSYEVTRDGRSFVFLSPRQVATGSRASRLVRVDNWFADLRAKLTP